ncbi:MAG: universal stress protein [Chloroflexi bacterium]|nr:universal stress protein [Chloroflexota bacterium]MBK6712944.1 universal stress protein [Chloroflexota bacterium]MBK7177448.1 universal stress protein [Chloroflexota bacterium]MBK7918860.1 universal stress protein [Chloroflexota bacterium]MBK8931939.1 universal stress protein [Chloroflexota bacterium]
MYKKILVPLDGSDRAAAILPHVIDMAQCNQASVTLLQVIEREVVLVSPYDPLTSFEPENLIAQQITDAEAYLDAHCAHLQELGIAVQRLVKRGPVVETVIEIANEADVDLIAMASHGRSGLARVLFGSVATGVLQHARQPLLLIRSR